MPKFQNKGIATSTVIIIVVILAGLLATGFVVFKQGLLPKTEPVSDNLIGGDKDEHGCLIAAGYSWCEAKQKCLRIWEEDCNGVEEMEINFIKTGNLVNNRMLPQTYLGWELVYEEPGTPALTVSLDISEESVCSFGDEEEFCREAKLNVGDRVTIEGVKKENENTVSVVTLTRVNE